MELDMRNVSLAACLFALTPGLVAHAETPSERIVRLAPVLAGASKASSQEKRQGIQQLLEIQGVSRLGVDLLFDRANANHEADPMVRREATLGIPALCDLRNRVYALRLARYASAEREPDPQVRIAALQGLARFECGDAAARILASTTEAGEPDPSVRVFANALMAKGVASSPY